MSAAQRSTRSQQTRDAILEHAVREISRAGIDELSVTSLIRGAGISRPTFYSYFGDISGLLAELWLARGEAWINRLVEPGEFSYDDDEMYALTEVFISAHRNEEIREVVEATTSRHFDISTDSAAVLAIQAWRMANRIGVLGTGRLWKRVTDALFLDSFLDALEGKPLKQVKTEVGELPEIELESSEHIDDQIAKGVIGIVGKDGVRSLSVLRLGRIMRVTSGYLNPRIDNLSELVAVTYALVQDSVARQNVALWNVWNLNPRGFARFIVGSIGGSRQEWRMFRNEVLVTASHDSALAELVYPSMESLVSIVGKRVAGFGFPSDVTARVSILVHTTLFGFSTLASAGVRVAELSHEGVIDGLIKELTKRRFRLTASR